MTSRETLIATLARGIEKAGSSEHVAFDAYTDISEPPRVILDGEYDLNVLADELRAAGILQAPETCNAIQCVRAALLDRGIRPDYHAAQIARLARDWPVLHSALQQLLAATRKN